MKFFTKKHLTVLVLSILFQNVYSQSNENIWRATSANRTIKAKGTRAIKPVKYALYQVDFQLLKNQLNKAPNGIETSKRLEISIPSPTGIQKFLITKTNLIPQHLQDTAADIQTFFGHNTTNPNEWITLDYTNHGFHAMITGGKNGGYFLDPYQLNDTENYLVYYRKDHKKKVAFECLLESENLIDDLDGDELNGSQNKSTIQTDCKLRTYRLAIACNAEYTAYHGGTQALAQSAIATTINRVNQMLRRDVGVVLTIVSGTNIIYTNIATDPYKNGDIYQMLDTNAYVMPVMIGTNNYDIGHVLGKAGGGFSGGLATRDVVCLTDFPSPTDPKAGGVTTLEDPIGDQFDIDFVAHEIAHQIGAHHTFNSYVGACSGYLQRSPTSAYETGSVSSIMAYAGLCNTVGLSTDVQANTDAFYHAASIYQMTKTLLTGEASVCGVITSTGNNKPVADAGPVFYNIPANTPFELTGNSTDADAADVHTYAWEQYDLAPTGAGSPAALLPGQNLPISTSTDQPNFRSFLPTTNKTRYFPTLDSLVANVMWPKFEKIPSVTRKMKFRLTVRDNSTSGCGCTDYDEIDINFDDTNGPFLVTYPNATGITWTAATSQTVTWNVAGTTNAPVSCANVNIMMSTDGGYTYPHALALNVPNDGSQNITVPNIGTTTARVKIICSDNIFFDISNNNFTIITIPVSTPEISFKTVLLETFEENIPDGNLDCRPYKDYTVTMQIANAPTGNATVTINSSGNATVVFDYRIIGSPITFTSGSTADKVFTVRIIDDGEVDPLENLELTYTISGATNATAGNNNQTCLVKIQDDEHAPYSGANPHFAENFDNGSASWDFSNNSGTERWFTGSGGDLSGAGQSLYISDNAGASNSYNTSNGYNYVSIESPSINGVGRNNQILVFDFVSAGDYGHDFGRVAYNSGAGVKILEGAPNAPYVNVPGKKTAEIVLPPSVNGSNFKLTWGWKNSVTNPAGVAGKGFEIDNVRVVEGTPGIRIETEVTTVLEEHYLGPFQSIYYYNPKDGNLMLYIQNTTSHDYGCTTVEVNRAGRGATQFQVDSVAFGINTYDVTDKAFKVIPSNNNPSGAYNITLFYTEDEIAGWEAATGNTRANLEIVKTIGNISTVTPATPQIPTTFYQTATLGAFGNDVTITSTFNNGFSGFAAGQREIPLPINLLNFNATMLYNKTVNLEWATVSEINNDYFTIERSTNATDWEMLTTVNGAGNSSVLLNYNTVDDAPYHGTSYYRLKQTDFDGAFEYSQLRSVTFNDVISEVSIFPNPANNELTIKGDPLELQDIQVYNVLGQNVTNKIKQIKINEATVSIDISQLSSGMYYFKTKTTAHKIYKE